MKEYICVESPNEVDGGMLVRERELIRCKDCARHKFIGTSGQLCPCPMDRYMGDEGYCSKAEPKVEQ